MGEWCGESSLRGDGTSNVNVWVIGG